MNHLSVPLSDRAQELFDIINTRIFDDGFLEMQNDIDSIWKQIIPMARGPQKNDLISFVKDLSKEYENYRNETAAYAAELSEIRPLDQWIEPYVGEAKLAGDYVNSGTVAQWLAERKNGFGGSDLGDLLGVTSGKFSKPAFHVVQEKATLDLDILNTAQNIITKNISGKIVGALARGNAWEAVIAHIYQDNMMPEDVSHLVSNEATLLKVLEAKGTFKGSSPWQTVNIDGLLCSDGKTPDGIFEAKTGSSTKYFRTEKDVKGKTILVPSLPPNYKAQVLNYLDATGFEYAILAALIGDNNFETFEIHKNDIIKGNMDFMEAKVILDDLWSQVISLRVEKYGKNWESYMEGMADRVEEKIADFGGVEAVIAAG